MRRGSRDRVDDFAGRIAGVGAGGELSAGDGRGSAFRNAVAGVGVERGRRLRDFPGAPPFRSRAWAIGDGEAEAVVVVRAIVRVTNLAGVDVVLRERAIEG